MASKCILSIIFLGISTILLAQGKLCIAKLNLSSEDGIGANHANETKRVKKVFDVQIDQLKKIRVSEINTVCINNLSVTKKHLIKIYRDNTLKESFWFTFDKNSNKKCLWYKGFYETWSLTDGFCK